MNDELIKKIYGHIPTNKYSTIKKSLGGYMILSLLGTTITNVPAVDISFLTLFLTSYFTLLPMSAYNTLDFTKDYNNLDPEYQLFLHNYSEFMKSLDIKSIAYLCGAFFYLYKNGYLSIDGEFKTEENKLFEGRRFQLVNIFNGYGLCRHITGSLKDILNYNGYPTGSLPIYNRKYEMYDEKDIENMRASIYQTFKDFNISEEEKTKLTQIFLDEKVMTHKLSVLSTMEKEKVSELDISEYRALGNHISVITSDGRSSIVYDSNINSFFRFQKDSKCDIINESSVREEYRLRDIQIYNTPSEEKRLIKNLKLYPMSLEGLREEQNEAIRRIKDNLDMIDRFREENLPLMKSLRDKAYKLV